MNQTKRSEWLQFRAKYPNEVTWKDFYDWAKNPKSVFNGDLEWDVKRAAEEYYRKRCLSLIIQYDRMYYNTVTAQQRLHAVYDLRLLQKGVKQKVAHSIPQIESSEEELEHIRMMIWQRLRRVVRDIYDFRNRLPEFRAIYAFLHPRVLRQVSQTKAKRKKA